MNDAFGTCQNGQLKTDNRVLKQQVQRLLSCRLDRARFPSDIKDMLVRRASNPQAFDENIWRKVLFTACTVLKNMILIEMGRNGVWHWNPANKIAATSSAVC